MKESSTKRNSESGKSAVVIIIVILVVVVAAAGLFVFRSDKTSSTIDDGGISTNAPISNQIQDILTSARRIAKEGVIVQSARNQTTSNLPIETIVQRDKIWTSANPDQAFKDQLSSNNAASQLRKDIAKSNLWSELFVTDNKGALVAAWPLTSDYWQGDETKFSAVLDENGRQVAPFWMGDPEWDASSKTYAMQLSVPVYSNGAPVGVLTAGVTLPWLNNDAKLEEYKKVRSELK